MDLGSGLLETSARSTRFIGASARIHAKLRALRTRRRGWSFRECGVV